MKRMELRLAKILRHVPENQSVPLQALAIKTSHSQGISFQHAVTAILELINRDYLEHAEDATVVRGSKPYPPEISANGGFYTFESECWSCGKAIDKNLDIYITKIYWECKDCAVKWTETVANNEIVS